MQITLELRDRRELVDDSDPKNVQSYIEDLVAAGVFHGFDPSSPALESYRVHLDAVTISEPLLGSFRARAQVAVERGDGRLALKLCRCILEELAGGTEAPPIPKVA